MGVRWLHTCERNLCDVDKHGYAGNTDAARRCHFGSSSYGRCDSRVCLWRRKVTAGLLMVSESTALSFVNSLIMIFEV